MALRILAIVTVLALVSTCWVGRAEAYVSGSSIADVARSNVGSTKWQYSSAHSTGRNTFKCNIFVADVLEEAGARVPRRWGGFGGPIGAREWGNPQSTYLRNARCWENRSSQRTGDVIAGGGHVGIVTGWGETTSALSYEPVKSNDWGFRSGQSVTFWRYTC